MPNPPVLSLIPKGCPDHPRFLIADQRQRIWTGNGWSEDENDGLLFASEKDAGQVAFEILSEATKNKPCFKFVAPVEIEVRSDEPPDMMALMIWLMKAARLFVDYRQPGLPDATTFLSIDWTRLKEVGK